ncbi:MAG: type II toxin-antitoxin system Phd/YefM family antitoxin [Alphaproteobacteria bacterium]
MAVYGVAEAKNKFTHLLERVEKGESITITRHGKPVAELKATSRREPKMTPEERRALYDEFVKRRRQRPPLGMSAVELIRAMRDGDPE